MATIFDLSLEVLARIFDFMDIVDSWTARAVCRAWRNVWDFQSQINLKETRLKVEIICRFKSKKGETMDQQVIDATLNLETRKSRNAGSRVMNWVSIEEKFIFWPGGNWRKYEIIDLISDIQVSAPHFYARLGKDITVQCRRNRSNTEQLRLRAAYETHERHTGAFEDFVLSILCREEKSSSGKVERKYRITSLEAPQWQINALLANYAQRERQWVACIDRHYLHSVQHMFAQEDRDDSGLKH
jgi:hypothetical protein